MLLAEPQSTPADFHFHIGRIPVRVTGWFWPAAGLFGWGLAQSLAGDDTRTLLIYLGVWVLVVFCSILVHELGHALAFAASGQSSHALCCITSAAWRYQQECLLLPSRVLYGGWQFQQRVRLLSCVLRSLS